MAGFLGLGRVAVQDERALASTFSFVVGLAIVTVDFQDCPPDTSVINPVDDDREENDEI